MKTTRAAPGNKFLLGAANKLQYKNKSTPHLQIDERIRL